MYDNYPLINDLAQILLTPHQHLSETIFDENNCIHNIAAKYLLSQANFILLQTALNKINNIEVTDIYLVGDYAGYYYNKYSEIECIIEYQNNGALDLSDDPDKLNIFLNSIYRGSLNNFNFEYNGIKVNFTLTTKNNDIFPKYSLLHNKWIAKPDKNSLKDIVLHEIQEEYNNRYYEIESYLAYNDINGFFQTPEGLEELQSYRKNIFKKSQTSWKESIIFKLLKHSGVIQRIDEYYSNNINAFLSIE